MKLFGTFFHLGYQRHVRYQLRKPQRLVISLFQEGLLLFRSHVRTGDDSLQITSDACHRCPEFMGDIAGHLLLKLAALPLSLVISLLPEASDAYSTGKTDN